MESLIHFMNKDGYKSMTNYEKKCINTFVTLNPTFKIIYWTNNDIDIFMKKNFKDNYNDWINNNNGFRGNLKKWDTARLCIIYIYGGFYADNDCTNLLSLENLLKYSLVLRKPVYRWSRTYKLFSQYSLPHTCNAFFGAKKNNIHILNIIKQIFNNYKKDKNMHVGLATGCLLLGSYVNQNIENNENNEDENIYLLNYYEFKEGPEKFDWITDSSLFDNLYVVHKINDNFSINRYLCFKEKIKR